MNDEELRSLATKRLKARNDFYTYLLIWLAVSLVVTFVWFMTGSGYFWPGWVIGGMGIAALFQFIDLIGKHRTITESAIDAEVQRIKRE
ncbi:2TM domain-containing protein [Schumannella luteola]